MNILSKTLKTISCPRSSVIQNALSFVPSEHFSSNITPIKMSFNVYESGTTDRHAPPVVIMHGLFGLKQNWRTVSKVLEKNTRRKIYSVDARNHGDSPHVPAHSSAHLCEDIMYLMQQENLKRISAIGHSMGGRAMMYFALKYPESLEKAIIVDISPISIPNDLEEMEALFNAMKDVKVPPNLSLAEARPAVASQIEKAVGDKDTTDFIMMNLKTVKSGKCVWRMNIAAIHASFKQFRATQNFGSMAPFTGPVLFIAGKQSNFLNLDDWPKIKKIFPKAELKWLNTNHLVHFNEPEQFVDLVSDFLN